MLEADKRPVSAVADNFEARDVVPVEIEQARNVDLYMMFDPGHTSMSASSPSNSATKANGGAGVAG